MSPPRTATMISAALSALLAVGGCTEPQPLGPIEPTTTASATPTKPDTSPTDPTPPTLPAAAKPNTAKGAARFAQHYIDLMNHASATGDVKPLQAKTSPECQGCDNYIDLYRKTYANGGFFKDDGWEPGDPVAYLDGSTATVLVDIDAPRTRFALKKGDQIKVGEGGRYKLRIATAFRAGAWAVTELTEQKALDR